jgi:hypothetical protein
MKPVHYHRETVYSKVYTIPESSPSYAHIRAMGILLSGEFVAILPTHEKDKTFANVRLREKIVPLLKAADIKHIGFARDNFIPGQPGDTVLIFKRESHAQTLTAAEERTVLEVLTKAQIISEDDAVAIAARLEAAPAKSDPQELAQLFDDIRSLPPEKRGAVTRFVQELQKPAQKPNGPERFIGSSFDTPGESARGVRS